MWERDSARARGKRGALEAWQGDRQLSNSQDLCQSHWLTSLHSRKVSVLGILVAFLLARKRGLGYPAAVELSRLGGLIITQERPGRRAPSLAVPTVMLLGALTLGI